MSNNGILPPWCSESPVDKPLRHDPRATYCAICRAGREVIELPDSPLHRTTQAIARPRNVASAAREVVNQRYQTTQNARPNQGSLIHNARPAVASRTTATPSLFSFVFVLVLETLQTDIEGTPPVIVERQHIGMFSEARTMVEY